MPPAMPPRAPDRTCQVANFRPKAEGTTRPQSGLVSAVTHIRAANVMC